MGEGGGTQLGRGPGKGPRRVGYRCRQACGGCNGMGHTAQTSLPRLAVGFCPPPHAPPHDGGGGDAACVQGLQDEHSTGQQCPCRVVESFTLHCWRLGASLCKLSSKQDGMCMETHVWKRYMRCQCRPRAWLAFLIASSGSVLHGSTRQL